MKFTTQVKTSLLSTLTAISLATFTNAGGIIMQLKPDTAKEPKNANGDYVDQVIKGFNKVLDTNKVIKKQFDKLETAAVGNEEERGGRYLGAVGNGFVMYESENVDFHARPGEQSIKNFTQTIVVFYSFGEGFRRGMESNSGVFATFEVKGIEKYNYNEKKDDHDLASNNVTATFKGFSTSLHSRKEINDKALKSKNSSAAPAIKWHVSNKEFDDQSLIHQLSLEVNGKKHLIDKEIYSLKDKGEYGPHNAEDNKAYKSISGYNFEWHVSSANYFARLENGNIVVYLEESSDENEGRPSTRKLKTIPLK